MKIICARLNTGEEIIAKFVGVVNSMLTEENIEGTFRDGKQWTLPEESIILEDVRIIALQQVPGNRGVGISFIPLTIANPLAKITINLSKCAMTVYPPQADLERAYIGENSGLTLATPETAAKSGIKLQ